MNTLAIEQACAQTAREVAQLLSADGIPDPDDVRRARFLARESAPVVGSVGDRVGWLVTARHQRLLLASRLRLPFSDIPSRRELARYGRDCLTAAASCAAAPLPR